MCQLFPWLEAEQAALTARYRENTHFQDIALVSFFETLSWFRLVLLQDAALLYKKFPQLALWNHLPFSSNQFRIFASQAQSDVVAAQQRASLALKDLPANIIDSVQGFFREMSLIQEQNQRVLTESLNKFGDQLSIVTDTLNQWAPSGSSGGRASKRAKGESSNIFFFFFFAPYSYGLLHFAPLDFLSTCFCFSYNCIY